MHCTHAVLLPLPSTRHVQTGMMRFGMLNMQEEHTVFTATGLLRCQCGVRTIATANSEYADAGKKRKVYTFWHQLNVTAITTLGWPVC